MSWTYLKLANPNQWLLKSVDDVEVDGFDDELFAIEIGYLAKNFRNFLRNSNRMARGMNTVKP